MTEFVGRLHPLIIHLPIGFVILLVVFEALALSPRFKHLTAAVPTMLTLTVPVSLLGALCGWLLAAKSDYEPTTLGWHRWLGVAFAVATLGLWVVQRRKFMWVYRLSLAAVVVLMAITGHYGGSLTHGQGYLTAPLRKFFGRQSEPPAKVSSPSMQAQDFSVFANAIQPILKASCVTCHGPKKSKAKLRLDTAGNIEQGGESGQVIVPNSADLSLLIKRIQLPLDDEDHMPPEGKRQVTPEELRVLRWWIDAGADAGKTLTQLAPPPDIAELIRAMSRHVQ